jgi:hypothetical protein
MPAAFKIVQRQPSGAFAYGRASFSSNSLKVAGSGRSLASISSRAGAVL